MTKNPLLLAGLTLLATSLSGCTTIEQAMEQRGQAIPEAERAYVMGTYKVACMARSGKCNAPFNAISTYYRSVSGPTAMTLRVVEQGIGGNTVHDFIDVEGEEKGIHFCHVVPAGEYSLFSFRYWNFAGGGSGFFLREEDQFDVRFAVDAGEIFHVGDIKQTFTSGRSLMGLARKYPGVMELAAGSDETALRALEKCPESARGLPVRSQPRPAAAGEHPLVVIKPTD